MRNSLLTILFLCLTILAHGQLFKAVNNSELTLVRSKNQQKLDKLTASKISNAISVVSIGGLSEGLKGADLEIGMPEVLGKSIVGKIIQLEQRSEDQFSLVAEADGDYIFFGKDAGRAYGQIRSGSNVYDIQYLSDDKAVVLKYDNKQLDGSSCANIEAPTRAKPIPIPASSDARASEIEPPVMNAIGATVRVLFLYTPAAAATGNDISSLVNTVLVQYNGARGYSQVNTQLQLAGIAALNFTEYYNESETYSQIAQKNALLTSQNATAQSLRDSYEADIVVTLTNGDFNNIAGSVITVGVDNAKSYAVVQIGQATSTYTAIHEIAHLFGCGHQNDNTVADYAHGYKWDTGVIIQYHFATLMYSPYNTGNNWTRTLHYSNPNVSRDGHATGAATANNAKALNVNGPAVANFRYTYISPTPVVSVSGPSSAGWGNSLNYSATITSPGTPPYSYAWVTDTGVMGTGTTFSVAMPEVSSLTAYVTVTDSQSKTANAFKVTTWNGEMSSLMMAPTPSSETLSEKSDEYDVLGEIFPNPASDHFEFDFNASKNATPVHVEVLNSIGVLQRVKQPSDTNGRYRVDISELSSGQYFVILKSGNQKSISRVNKK